MQLVAASESKSAPDAVLQENDGETCHLHRKRGKKFPLPASVARHFMKPSVDDTNMDFQLTAASVLTAEQEVWDVTLKACEDLCAFVPHCVAIEYTTLPSSAGGAVYQRCELHWVKV
eukprot:6188252-Pleurochrysis_carterae.AAC.2